MNIGGSRNCFLEFSPVLPHYSRLFHYNIEFIVSPLDEFYEIVHRGVAFRRIPLTSGGYK